MFHPAVFKQNLVTICSAEKTLTGKVERERIWHLSISLVGTLSKGTDGSGILTESQRLVFKPCTFFLDLVGTYINTYMIEWKVLRNISARWSSESTVRN